jgi:hypothetical protein
VADLDWVAEPIYGRPRRGEILAERAEAAVSLDIRCRARPDPLDGEGSLAPAVGDPAVATSDAKSDARAGDLGQRLRPELERHARRDGQEMERHADGSDV